MCRCQASERALTSERALQLFNFPHLGGSARVLASFSLSFPLLLAPKVVILFHAGLYCLVRGKIKWQATSMLLVRRALLTMLLFSGERFTKISKGWLCILVFMV